MQPFYPCKHLLVRNEVSLDSPIRNGMSVRNERNVTRLDCDYKCLLQHDDIEYPFEMKNISTSGALGIASFIIPVNIQLGDTCNLLFSSFNTMPPRNYKSKVTRLEDSKIAVRFLKKSLCI